MFFVDKYAPKTPADLVFHKKEFEVLQKMSTDNAIPNIIFYGPDGSGKKTLANLFMELMYDKDVNDVHDTVYKVIGSGNVAKDVVIKQSNYHIVIEPKNNNFDRYLIQDVVKTYAQKVPLIIFTTKKLFKTVVIDGIDNLSYYAQTSLRRTMEIYSNTCRFIMWCKSLSRVIDPIRSRCFPFRISSPSDGDFVEFILKISYLEHLQLSLKDYTQIIDRANGNIKNVLWMLQLKKYKSGITTSYEKEINNIVHMIINGDITDIISIRGILYNITVTNIPGTKIIRDLIIQLYNRKEISENHMLGLVELANKYEHNLIRGRHEIMHLDAFISGAIKLLHK